MLTLFSLGAGVVPPPNRALGPRSAGRVPEAVLLCLEHCNMESASSRTLLLLIKCSSGATSRAASAPGVGSGDAGGADAPLPLSMKIACRKKRPRIANDVPSVRLHQAAAQQSTGPPWDDSLRPKAESNLGAGLIGRNGRTTFRPRSRQKLRPDMGRFRPVGSGAAGLLGRRAAAASLAEGLGTDFGRHGRRVRE